MKINEKNLAAFATSGNHVDREGYLMKKGDGQKGYSKRWFILKGNLLFYFVKNSDRQPIGVIILEGSTIELAESDMNEHYCFKILFTARTYTLSAETHEIMEQWMRALACANYDYIKFMAAELQRQLDELSTGYPISEGSSLSVGLPSVHSYRPTTSVNPNEPSTSHHPHHVPTPPPRSKSTKNIRSNEKKTFEHLHKEFGAKILRDQEARWAKSRDNQSPSKSVLSVVKQNSLINL